MPVTRWMRIGCAGAVASLLSACASLPPAASLTLARSLVLQHQAGLYVPQAWTIQGDSLRPQLLTLERWAATQGILISHQPLDQHALHGRVYHDALIPALILVNADDSPNMQVYTLLHELGHVYSPRTLKANAVQEAFAELVAVQVMKGLGVDARRATVAYLAAHIEDDGLLFVAMRYGTEIDHIVVRLERAAQE